MFRTIISIAFLGIMIIPVIILFLTLIKTLGEEARKTAVKQQYSTEDLEIQKRYIKPIELKRIK